MATVTIFCGGMNNGDQWGGRRGYVVLSVSKGPSVVSLCVYVCVCVFALAGHMLVCCARWVAGGGSKKKRVESSQFPTAEVTTCHSDPLSHHC